MELYLHSPVTPSWRGAQFKIAQGNVTLVPVTTVRCVLRLQLRRRSPDTDGRCEHIEYAVVDNR
jgi:hypothetical protein